MPDNDNPSIAGRHGETIGNPMGEVPVKLDIDVQAVNKLNEALKAVKETVTGLATQLERAGEASGMLTGSGTGTTNGHATTGNNSSLTAAPGQGGQGLFGRSRWANLFQGPFSKDVGLAGGAEKLGATFGASSAGSARMLGRGVGAMGLAGFAGGRITTMIDNRVDRNRAYGLAADQVGVRTRILNGWSEGQYERYRSQIVGDKGDVFVDPNALIQFENQTGIGAADTRNAVATGRALSGFDPSVTTQSVLNAYASNFDPRNANRQFMMMGGLSMLGPGGKPRNFQATMGTWSEMFQLDNRFLAKGARLPGSVQRYRMGMAGIAPEMQDMLIEYGMAQSTFREKGGRGRFDPTKEEHRKLAGVDDAFATQFDETERRRMQREESMYQDQNKNYAKLEENTQTMIGHLENIEGMFKDLIGLRTRNRNWLNIGGRVVQGVGSIMTVAGIASGNPILAGAGAAVAAGGTAAAGGDPPENSPGSSSGAPNLNTSSKHDGNIMVPYGYSGNGPGPRISLNELKNKDTFKNMSATMQTRLLAMMRDNPDVGIGTGQRANTAQEFMRRYREVPAGTQGARQWNGRYWKLRGGEAPYAPPGRSMHEIGLAADLVGDIAWMNKNAGKYGLKHFAGVNNEPWHVQPAELPNSRRDYEKGRGGELDTDFGEGEDEGMVVDPVHEAISMLTGGGSTDDFTGMSIQGVLDTYLTRGYSGPTSKSGLPSSRKSIGNTSQDSQSLNLEASAGVVNKTTGDALSATEVARIAKQAGFSGDALIKMVAIAKGESRFDPDVHGDVNLANSKWGNSIGLWQVRSLKAEEGKGTWRDASRLEDPYFNARAAYNISSGGKNLTPWTVYNKGIYKKYMGEATQAVQSMGGDPDLRDRPVNYSRTNKMRMPVTVSAGGGSGPVTHQYQIDFSPVFKFEGSADTQNLQKVAREAASYLREQTEIALKRSE